MTKLLYLGYYLRELDRSKFYRFADYVVKEYKMSKYSLYKDVLRASFKYNISLLDYFYFKFYTLDKRQKQTYAGTGYMYEYQLKMNPKSTRDILENKLLFLKAYSKYIHHNFSSKEDFIKNEETAKHLLSNKSKKIVLKSSDGQCGEGIEVLNIEKLGVKKVIEKITKSANDLIEEFIVQHDNLMRLSPSGLNTIRIFTQLNDLDKVEFLGARLRITIDSYVDNLAAGNIAAPIDMSSGIVSGTGVYSDISKDDEEIHPISKEPIPGFKIPFWEKVIEMVKGAALLHPQNRSVGWDVAITNQGPELLEGNHNWCKLLWQLPVKKGLKNELEKYL